VNARSAAAVLGTAALVAALLTAAVQVEAARERAYPTGDDSEDYLYLRSGLALRRLTGAYNALAADVYWIRAVVYYGGTKRLLAKPQGPDPPPSLAAPTPEGYALLYPLLDVTTTLDPRFNIAYRFGAVFLAESYPRGVGRPDLAIALLEKGLRERPDKWEYMQDIGFVHYWFNHDYRAAGEWFQKAGDVPGAPWWLRSLAATTLAQGGDRQSSRAMWQAIRQSAEIEWQRTDSERRLAQLQALDDIDALQRSVDELAARVGVAPTAWETLVRARVLRAIPLDPSRVPYELTPDGRVRVSQSSSLSPLPDEPQRTPARPPA
jgi:hypothetical protein